MSYTINKFNGTQVAVVANGTTDSTLDLTLIGKNYAGYGEVQNENFVFLLENFAGNNQPPRPITGQLWFDTSANRLKFYDSNRRFRVASGAEVNEEPPEGLETGDFWFNSKTNQLFAWTGSAYTLVGPQSISSTNITQMVSATLQDNNNPAGTHAVIQAVSNSTVVYIISSDPDFTLDQSVNAIPGFNVIRQGITMVYSNDPAQEGQTTSDHRYWGTASNSDRLGGLPVSSFVQTGAAKFDTVVQFYDVGYTVGYPIAKLKVYNENATTPTLHNQRIGGSTAFKTTLESGSSVTPLLLTGKDVTPGVDAESNLGTSELKWKTVYASSFVGIASKADALKLGTDYKTASTSAVADTIVARTSVAETVGGTTVTAGAIKATYFVGTATTANYADLAEKYIADAHYEIGTVMSVGGKNEVTASKWGDRALGAVSEKPAYLMNRDLVNGTVVALKGRVPVKVFGPVTKGDRLVAGGELGTAIVCDGGAQNVANTFAIALETNNASGIKLVESVIL